MELSERGFIITLVQPWLGHMNRINQLIIHNKAELFSFSNDCTARIWDIASNTCTRIFKFTDPVTCGLIDAERNFLFCGSWDRSVKAIDLKTNEIDSSFIASRECIKCMHLCDKWLFVSGIDPIIRAFDLETGACKTFETHSSWVLSLQTYTKYKEDGSIEL